MDTLWMVLAFSLAAYSIIANDSIQTLGTFMSSNSRRPWWILWIWISGIMVTTVTVGWFANGGDPAFGRLTNEALIEAGKDVPFPEDYGGRITWIFVIPPLALVLLTRSGIPVSTSLLVLTAFKGLVAQQQGKGAADALSLFRGMMEKSLMGYAIAFALGLVICLLVTGALERRIHEENKSGVKDPHPVWMVFQWLSTGFLWSMWLVQDLANVFAYLPRQLQGWGLCLALLGMTLLQGYLFREKGGKIQRVVTSKTNTLDVRSATFIDFLYGLVLLFFKLDILGIWPKKMPMSTTWVFLGLLAGREIGIALKLRHRSRQQVRSLVFGDA
ncbi:MAG: hypothetical protein ACQKBU_03165, partial [Verrucomicrobiales bacterium]